MYIYPIQKASSKNSLLQMLAAWKVIRSESGAPITTAIILESSSIILFFLSNLKSNLDTQ